MAGISDASTSRGLKEKPSPRGDPAPLPRGRAPARERKATPARGSSTPVETLFAPAWGASTTVEIFFAPACGSSTTVEIFFAPACGSSTTVEIFFAHAHSKWLIFDHFHRAGAIFLSQRHPNDRPVLRRGDHSFTQPLRGHSESPRRCLAAVPMGGGSSAPGHTDGATAVQNSPCSLKMAQFGTFCPRRANFLPLSPRTSHAGRTLYRIQAGYGSSKHNNTTGHTSVKVSRGSNE